MKKISYISLKSNFLTQKDIQEIEEISRQNNSVRGITGFFTIIDRYFFQTIEGESDSINQLFEKIQKDPRHYQVICLSSEEHVNVRQFPDWSMNWVKIDENLRMGHVLGNIFTSIIDLQNNLVQYTQPKVFNFLTQGILPSTIKSYESKKTILMCDIAEFTMLCERLATKDLIAIVNQFLEITCINVNKCGGEINKIMGDCILAVFDSFSPVEAVQAAVNIIQDVAELRQKSQNNVFRFLHCGIGIDTGIVTEGNIGNILKKDFTILGTAVNTAARLESLTRFFQKSLVFSKRTADLIQNHWKLEYLGEFKIKGKKEKEHLYTIEGLHDLNTTQIEEEFKMIYSQS